MEHVVRILLLVIESIIMVVALDNWLLQSVWHVQVGFCSLFRCCRRAVYLVLWLISFVEAQESLTQPLLFLLLSIPNLLNHFLPLVGLGCPATLNVVRLDLTLSAHDRWTTHRILIDFTARSLSHWAGVVVCSGAGCTGTVVLGDATCVYVIGGGGQRGILL